MNVIELNQRDKERFLTKVEKTNSCWIWKEGIDLSGYGRFHLTRTHSIAAHRFSWLIFKGSIPEGMLVCHTCDTPFCVNPEHLFLGTDKDNSDDKLTKNRQGLLCKLTSKQVLEIRCKYIPRIYSQSKLAREYNVNQTTIHNIVHNHSWKHV